MGLSCESGAWFLTHNTSLYFNSTSSRQHPEVAFIIQMQDMIDSLCEHYVSIKWPYYPVRQRATFPKKKRVALLSDFTPREPQAL